MKRISKKLNWKLLRNFYSSKTWQQIKEREDQNGRCDEKERQEIAKKSVQDRWEQSKVTGRFRKEPN
jgi:hypothetical protein